MSYRQAVSLSAMPWSWSSPHEYRVDLGWYGKPSGLASIALEGSALHLRNIARLERVDEILDWIQTEAGEPTTADRP